MFLFNTDLCECVKVKIQAGIFSDRPKRVALKYATKQKETGEFYRCINAHLPWIPDGFEAKELTQIIQKSDEP